MSPPPFRKQWHCHFFVARRCLSWCTSCRIQQNMMIIWRMCWHQPRPWWCRAVLAMHIPECLEIKLCGTLGRTAIKCCKWFASGSLGYCNNMIHMGHSLPKKYEVCIIVTISVCLGSGSQQAKIFMYLGLHNICYNQYFAILSYLSRFIMMIPFCFVVVLCPFLWFALRYIQSS